MENLLTPKDAALLLDTSVGTVRRLIREGRIGAVRLSPGTKGRFRIPESEVERFMTPTDPVSPAVSPAITHN